MANRARDQRIVLQNKPVTSMRLHPFVLITACFFIGVIAAVVVARPDLERLQQSERRDHAVPSLADPSYSPHDVVRQQIDSLAGALTDSDAIRHCYGFASPRNRATIGSVQQFSRLLANPRYTALLGHTGHIIGQSRITGDTATVLVTVIDADARPHAYRFWLQRQSNPPLAACWMTDAVLPVGQESRLDFPVLEPTVLEPTVSVPTVLERSHE